MFTCRLLIRNMLAQESFDDYLVSLNVFSRRSSLSTAKHVRETYADCAIAFNGNAEIASSPCLTATASGALVGSNVIAGAFSRSPYVALDDIFGQVRFPFSCLFLFYDFRATKQDIARHVEH